MDIRHARSRRPLRALPVLALFGLLLPEATPAQILRGRVLDAASSGAVAGAELRLLADTVLVGSALTNADGRYYLEAPRGGVFAVEVSALGYHAYRAEAVELSAGELRLLTARLDPEPITLEELTARVNAHPLRHELSYAGLYARHRGSPSVGRNRVLMRTDPELAGMSSVRDVLELFPMPFCAPYVFWNGFYIGRAVRTTSTRFQSSRADDQLDLSIRDIEGVEHYRDFAALPMGLREALSAKLLNVSPSAIRRCGAIAIWPRRTS